MSLSLYQKQSTRKEFKENIKRSGLPLEQIAQDLQTTTDYLEQVIELRSRCLEDPWILRNYLVEHMKHEGIAALPFTALKSDHHNYWFLDHEIIDAGTLYHGGSI